jgi:hypothetical protein
MAFLEGEASFETKVINLEEEIRNRLLRLKQLNTAYNYIIGQHLWLDFENEYDALMSHWREDSAISNFEFHSYLIEIMIKLMQQLSEPVSVYSLRYTTEAIAGERQLLSKITFGDVPRLIEAMAKIRGLVTHASISGQSDEAIRMRVKFLLQAVIQHKEELRSALGNLQKATLNATPTLFESLLHEHKINQLYQLIHNEFLTKKHITAGSHNIFDFVTDIIDLYSAIFEQGVNLVQHYIDAAYALTPLNHTS